MSVFEKFSNGIQKVQAIYTYAREDGDSRAKAAQKVFARAADSLSRALRRAGSPIYMQMDRPGIEKIPPVPPLPEGFILRNYKQGDEAGMARVFAASWLEAVTPKAVRHMVIEDPAFRPERVFIIEHEGRVVAAGLAYVYPDEPEIANPRMLSALPKFRGQKLGLIMSFAIINYYKNEGFQCMRYATQQWRQPALKLFFGLGFYPLLENEADRKRWEEIAAHHGVPEIMAKAKYRNQ